MILMTPADVVKADFKLWAYCAFCRRNAYVSAEALCIAGRGDVVIGNLRFSCAKCGTPGRPSVTGHQGHEQKTWE